jgi:hypothetical protein
MGFVLPSQDQISRDFGEDVKRFDERDDACDAANSFHGRRRTVVTVFWSVERSSFSNGMPIHQQGWAVLQPQYGTHLGSLTSMQ